MTTDIDPVKLILFLNFTNLVYLNLLLLYITLRLQLDLKLGLLGFIIITILR